MAIDRYDWHSDGDFPDELDKLAGGTHIGFFIYWLITRDKLGSEHLEDEVAQEDVLKVKNGEMSGRDFLFKNCDGKFWDADIENQTLPFVLWYYGDSLYFVDIEELLSEYKTVYHAEDTRNNADLVAKVIDGRFKKWLSSTKTKKF